MKSFTTLQLTAALTCVGIKEGDTILVHSSLFHLGKMSDVPLAKAPSRIADIILELIGREGTLLTPAFNFDFCKGASFDRRNTPSKGMGVFSEIVRKHPNSIRSSHPMQSFAGIGKHAATICAPDLPSSFSTGGPVSEMLKVSAKLLLLGAPMQAASIIHFAEEKTGVPYRYWKEFTGPYIDNSIESQRSYQMYVRDLERNVRLDLSKLDRWLDEAGLLASAPLGSGAIKSCGIKDFLDIAMQRMTNDPEILIRSQDQN